MRDQFLTAARAAFNLLLLEARGYSGYLFLLPPHLPADDRLAVAQKAFQDALRSEGDAS